MEPRRTTPPDASACDPFEQFASAPEEDLYAGAGADPAGDGARGRGTGPPPSGQGWSAHHGAPPPPRSSPGFSAFFLLLEGLRRAAPAELQDGLRSFMREGLLTLRSLIDWYLERLERAPRRPQVEDIPIDT